MVRGSLQNVGTILIEGFYRFKFTYEDFLNIRKFSFDAGMGMILEVLKFLMELLEIF